jgi:CheY-like chemotaxis protein
MMLLKDKRIFIVEDNLQNRIVFQMALIRHGAEGDFERHGKETIFHLKNLSRVDLIILDLMLAGGIDGFDIYDQIRALPQFAAVPIIAVSAMDPSIAIPKARMKGFAGFIAKPINTDLFPKQLATVIGGEQVWHTGERTL